MPVKCRIGRFIENTAASAGMAGDAGELLSQVLSRAPQIGEALSAQACWPLSSSDTAAK